jgi:acyl carrier protein
VRWPDVSRREVIVALIASAVGASAGWWASRRMMLSENPKEPPSDNEPRSLSDHEKKPASENQSAAPNVPAKIHDIIVAQLGVDDDEVRYESSFVDDLGADSLDTVELVMAFEEEFNIEIPDKDAQKLSRVGELVEYLRNRKALK